MCCYCDCYARRVAEGSHVPPDRSARTMLSTSPVMGHARCQVVFVIILFIILRSATFSLTVKMSELDIR